MGDGCELLGGGGGGGCGVIHPCGVAGERLWGAGWGMLLGCELGLRLRYELRLWLCLRCEL